jgi:hypothetical protein
VCNCHAVRIIASKGKTQAEGTSGGGGMPPNERLDIAGGVGVDTDFMMKDITSKV